MSVVFFFFFSIDFLSLSAVDQSIVSCPCFFVAQHLSHRRSKNKLKTLRQCVRNRKTRQALMETLSAAGVVESGCEKSVGDLLYTISTKVRN